MRPGEAGLARGARGGREPHRKNICPVSGAATPLYRPPMPSAASVFCAARRASATCEQRSGRAGQRGATSGALRPTRATLATGAARARRAAPPRGARLGRVDHAVVNGLVARLRLQQHLQRIKRVADCNHRHAAARPRRNVLHETHRLAAFGSGGGHHARLRRGMRSAARAKQRASAAAQQRSIAQRGAQRQLAAPHAARHAVASRQRASTGEEAAPFGLGPRDGVLGGWQILAVTRARLLLPWSLAPSVASGCECPGALSLWRLRCAPSRPATPRPSPTAPPAVALRVRAPRFYIASSTRVLISACYPPCLPQAARRARPLPPPTQARATPRWQPSPPPRRGASTPTRPS
jgi:hypothetical protein